MNIQRFGLPVIIAAGLHGTLFLVSSEPPAPLPEPPAKVIPIDLKPIPEDERIRMPQDDPAHDSTPAGGPVAALPELPDIVKPLTDDEPFVVPVTTERPVIKPEATLKDYTGLPAGPGGPGDWGNPPIPDISKLDRLPRAVVQRPPAYPELMRREGVNGSVTVEFVVDPAGRVVRAEAVKWTHREFVDPAVRAVRDWRFEPGTQHGRKVSFRVAVPIEFNAAQ